MTAPVLLLAYRRPDTTRQVLAAIRQAAPQQLFVACDGPNPDREGEAARVQAVRDLIDCSIDWPCEVHRRYSREHQGCRRGVSGAISWFFEHVEQGIVLEDDCVPDPSFFPFCEALLDRYAHDLRVWCITGGNYQDGQVRGDASYYFSRYPHCWGWASWRSRWQAYDDELSLLEPFVKGGFADDLFTDPLEAAYWHRVWSRQVPRHGGGLDSWAYQWAFACMASRGLTAIPNQNLVMNVGDGVEATHTTTSQSMRQVCNPVPFPLRHPRLILRDETADQYTFINHMPGRYLNYMRSLKGRFADPLGSRLALAIRNPLHYPVKLLTAISLFFRHPSM